MRILEFKESLEQLVRELRMAGVHVDLLSTLDPNFMRESLVVFDVYSVNWSKPTGQLRVFKSLDPNEAGEITAIHLLLNEGICLTKNLKTQLQSQGVKVYEDGEWPAYGLGGW